MMTTTQHDRLILRTFGLIDGRRVTYQGFSDNDAFNRACAYHPGAVTHEFGATQRCQCANKRAKGTREAGSLICADSDCAGFIG